MPDAVPLAVIPLKGWTAGKQRLAGTLGPRPRKALAAETAGRVASALASAGFEVAVIAGNAGVAAWAEQRGLIPLPDPGSGLDGAGAAAVEAAGERPWCLVHGDLPLLSESDVRMIDRSRAGHRTVLCPARDGGTNVIASQGRFRFRFGPGSFHRHLGAAATPVHVLVTPGTAIEIDTPRDLLSAAALPGGEWLQRFVP